MAHNFAEERMASFTPQQQNIFIFRIVNTD